MKIYWSGESKNIIGNKLKELRKKAKLTQKALAEKLQLEGVEFSSLTILRIEQGTRFVPDYELLAIANFFKITADELLTSNNNESSEHIISKTQEANKRVAEQMGIYKEDDAQTLDVDVHSEKS